MADYEIRFGRGILSCASLTTALTSSQLGRLTGRFSEKVLLKTAFLVYAAALLMVPFVPSVWLLILPAILAASTFLLVLFLVR